MGLSESAEAIKKIIYQAIEDHSITHDDYEKIMDLALKDGHIDSQEKAMLAELQDMIEHKQVRFRKK